MQMIQDRTLTSHTTNRSQADEIAQRIEEGHLPCFLALRRRLSAIAAQEEEERRQDCAQPGEPRGATIGTETPGDTGAR